MVNVPRWLTVVEGDLDPRSMAFSLATSMIPLRLRSPSMGLRSGRRGNVILRFRPDDQDRLEELFTTRNVKCCRPDFFGETHLPTDMWSFFLGSIAILVSLDYACTILSTRTGAAQYNHGTA